MKSAIASSMDLSSGLERPFISIPVAKDSLEPQALAAVAPTKPNQWRRVDSMITPKKERFSAAKEY